MTRGYIDWGEWYLNSKELSGDKGLGNGLVVVKGTGVCVDGV